MENQQIVSIQNIFSSRLDTLSHLLKVVENHFTDDVESIFGRWIAPDMLPFGTQIAFTCNQPRNFALWCLGQPASNLSPEVASLDDALGHLSSTQELLASINVTDDRRERNSSVGMSIATKIAANQLVQYVGVERSMDLGTVTEFGHEVASKGVILDVRIDNVIKKEGKGAVPMVSAILPDGSTKEIGGMLRNSIPLAPGTVVSALATKKLNPQIDLKIGEGRYRVKPVPDQSEQTIISTKALIGFSVSEAGISITATTIPKKKTEVPITTELGILFPKDRAEFLKSGVQSAEGIYSRTLHPNQIELHVQDLVAHQPVSKILANTLLPLADREINPDVTAILEKPQLTLVPDIEASVNPSPPDNLPVVEPEVNLRIVPDIPQTYSPSRIELVDWYKASLKVAEPATAQYLVELGTQLKSVYTSEALSQGNPPVDRLPDAYQSSEVLITSEEKDKFDGILAAAQEQEIQTSKQVSRGSR